MDNTIRDLHDFAVNQLRQMLDQLNESVQTVTKQAEHGRWAAADSTLTYLVDKAMNVQSELAAITTLSTLLRAVRAEQKENKA